MLGNMLMHTISRKDLPLQSNGIPNTRLPIPNVVWKLEIKNWKFQCKALAGILRDRTPCPR